MRLFSPAITIYWSLTVHSMLCRQENRALAAIEKIKSELPGAEPKIDYINFDLQNLKSAKKAAEDFMQRETRLGS